MKKGIAAGIAGLLMMGTASQALASFESTSLVLSVYDSVANKEVGVDLGTVTDYSAQNVILATGLSFAGLNFDTRTSGVGVFATYMPPDEWDAKYAGYFATNRSNGILMTSNYDNASIFNSAVNAITLGYRNMDPDQDGVVNIAATWSGSYYVNMNFAGSSIGSYSLMMLQGGVEPEYPATSEYVDMYLYGFSMNAEYEIVAVTGATTPYAAVIRLTSDGQVILNPNATTPGSDVPVPGAAWLLGSGLIGLAGLRRRFNG